MVSGAKDIQILRTIGKLEGVSYLLLLGIAMPLKYIWSQPMAVKITGWAHGALFILLCMYLLIVWRNHGWAFKHVVLVFVAALLPFGPFVIDRRIEGFGEKESA